ncbi:hypothetical protein C9374_013212 [Naegleria lovaniensis]|uniref:Alpha/beta hydrolase fold-3 domain-containing protein n=1 Tax=Naegleria lovaniensis TaxID=51637 RepID=A0AA88GC31_NAELO|nr:uncharacterized protein C9374_013212 [Naegleria lovaniensis]KAG2372760.1 hypothetical protein C9374_013212 [Naegleria lovaniensis]
MIGMVQRLWFHSKVFFNRHLVGSLAYYIARFKSPNAYHFKQYFIPNRYDHEQTAQRVLVYFPRSSSPNTNNHSSNIYINIHPGGFVSGYPEDCSEFCDLVAQELNCIVVAPQYGLAPEYPFPKGLYDCLNAVEWSLQEFGNEQNPRLTKLAVGGFSAGGNLAFGLAQLIVSKNIPLECLISFYPPMNFTSQSKSTFQTTNPLKRCVYYEAYLQAIIERVECEMLSQEEIEKLLQDPLLSPSYASIEMLPRSVMLIAAQYDPNIADMEQFMNTMRIRYEELENNRLNHTQNSRPYRFYGEVYERVFHGWNFIPEFLLRKDGTQKKWHAYQQALDELERVFKI